MFSKSALVHRYTLITLKHKCLFIVCFLHLVEMLQGLDMSKNVSLLWELPQNSQISRYMREYVRKDVTA